MFRKLIFTALILSTSVAFAENYNKSNSINCGGTSITLESTCIVQKPGSFSAECLDQTFTFSSVPTKTFKTDVGQYKSEEGNMLLNYQVTSWACTKNNKEQYLIVTYGNGGNCEECEWLEIIDHNGQRLTFDTNVEKAKTKFETAYDQLGLPKPWPSDSFKEISLKNDNTPNKSLKDAP